MFKLFFQSNRPGYHSGIRVMVGDKHVHIQQILCFLRCNFYNCTMEVCETTLIRPAVKYASAVLDPYLATDISRLEQVQRQGACFVHQNYWETTPGCVSRMIAELGWQSIEESCHIHRLVLLTRYSMD